MLVDSDENKSTENNKKEKNVDANDINIVDASKIDIRVEVFEQSGSNASDTGGCSKRNSKIGFSSGIKIDRWWTHR